MSAGNVKHQAAVAATADQVDELRGDIHRQLQVLRDLDTTLEHLVSTRQSVGLGFMTEAATAARDKQVHADREAARGGTLQSLGPVAQRVRWARSTTVLGTGQVAAPVTMTAVSASAEIVFTLQHHVRRLARPAAIAAAATIPGGKGRPPIGLTTDADIEGLTRQLDDLVDAYTNTQGLQALLRELDHLEELGLEVTEGPARSSHPDVCPWCGRPTLVIHHREKGRDAQFIRCEGRHACECSYEWCDCHRNPIRNRHEWVNSGRAAHTWHQLHNLQTKRKELAMLETKALDAIERIRELHTPTYVVDGVEYTHRVMVPGDEIAQLAPDHECVTAGFDACEIYPDDPAASVHYVPACSECQVTVDDGPGYRIYPCPTIRAIDPPEPAAEQPAGDTSTAQETR